VTDLLRRVDLEEALEGARTAVDTGNWTEAERLIARARAIDPRNPALASLAARTEAGLGALHAGDLERAALRAFFSGQYQETVDLLAKVLARSGASPRAYFYAACGSAALALVDGGAERLAAARDLFAKARPFSDQLTADRKYISPRILRVIE
jgi:hypothetical protein